jgi:hypothetical protein
MQPPEPPEPQRSDRTLRHGLLTTQLVLGGVFDLERLRAWLARRSAFRGGPLGVIKGLGGASAAKRVADRHLGRDTDNGNKRRFVVTVDLAGCFGGVDVERRSDAAPSRRTRTRISQAS